MNSGLDTADAFRSPGGDGERVKERAEEKRWLEMREENRGAGELMPSTCAVS